MKKLIVLILIALCFSLLPRVNANPFPPHCMQPVISELYFSEPGIWTLEVHFIPWDVGLMHFDSIVMHSQTSRVKIRSAAKESTSTEFDKQLYYSGTYPGFYLDQDQDTLTLVAHWSSQSGAQTTFTHSLAYGYPDCFIPVVYPGQSICSRISEYGFPTDYFYKTNSPTIGAANTFTDATATVSGKIYDLNGQLMTWVPECHSLALKQNIEWIFIQPESTFYFDFLGMTIDSAGNFTTEIAAHQSALTKITRLIGECDPNGALVFQDITCASVPFNFEPGDILETDLHLTGNGFMVGLPGEPDVKPVISVVSAPNPFSEITYLYIESAQDLSGVEVIFYSASGNHIKTFTLTQGNKTTLAIHKSDLGSAGIYLFQVQRAGELISKGKLICN
jgi:hypothetical protein